MTAKNSGSAGNHRGSASNHHADLYRRIAAYGQEHLLAFYDQLPPIQQSELLAQIESLDFGLITELAAGVTDVPDWHALAERAQSPPAIRLDGHENPYSAQDAAAAGRQAFAEGRVAVLVVAGGQGTRLGFPHPKGVYPIGPLSGRTLFQIHADRIAAANAMFGVSIPFLVMTSPATHDETVAYFEANDNLGLSDVTIFCQATMPAVDIQTGRLMLAEKHRLFQSPNGHGGTLAALVDSGSLAKLQDRGIQYLFYFQVDNPLVDIADCAFAGYHVLSGSEMTSQVIGKTDPLEKVGNVVSVDGTLRIVEYSDLPEEHAKRRNPDGSLAIWAGSIAVHVFDIAFLDRCKDSADALPYHHAKKKVPFIDGDGKRIEPTGPNAIKFERFIFDLLPLASNALVVEVSEAESFAPLKNAPDAAKDTEATVQSAMVALHRHWLHSAGAKVASGVKVEIHPGFAATLDQLRERIEPGRVIDENRYFVDA